MTDRHILFSGPMVRALIAGTKTQTRRLLGFDSSKVEEFIKVGTDPAGRSVFEMKDKLGRHMTIPAGKHLVTPHYSPRIAVADRLYVREAWHTNSSEDAKAPRDIDESEYIWYVADGAGSMPISRFRQGMHMPRWASRITLIVEGVKIERLQDISEDDAIAEGIERHKGGWLPYSTTFYDGDGVTPANYHTDPRISYRQLWNKINGFGAWDANPWVVAYTFTVHHCNIDAMSKEAA